MLLAKMMAGPLSRLPSGSGQPTSGAAAPQSETGVRPSTLPPAAKLIIAFEFCERFGFYSMLSLLALFLSASRAAGGFGWHLDAALSMLGAYTGLMYALPVGGGWIADRFLGHRRALAFGGALMFLGYVLLTLSVLAPRLFAGGGNAGMNGRLASAAGPLGAWHIPAGLTGDVALTYFLITAGFWAAVLALIVGNALMKSTLVVVLGDSFTGDDARREAAYSYYYTGINLGGFVAGLAAGTAAATYGWAAAFGISALAMGMAVTAYLTVGLRLLRPLARRRHSSISSAACAADDSGTGTRLVFLAIFASMLLVYEAGTFQLWGSMSLFLQHGVNRHAGAFEIPTQWFTSVNAGAIILAAPSFACLWAWLARRGREPDIFLKYALALLLGAAGLLSFAAAAGWHPISSKPGWGLPALGIAVQAAGEVAAWTVSYGLVYRLAPRRMVAAIMGAFYATTLGLGGYLAGMLGELAGRWGEARFFLLFGVVTAATAIVAVLIRPALLALAAARHVALSSPTS